MAGAPGRLGPGTMAQLRSSLRLPDSPRKHKRKMETKHLKDKGKPGEWDGSASRCQWSQALKSELAQSQGMMHAQGRGSGVPSREYGPRGLVCEVSPFPTGCRALTGIPLFSISWGPMGVLGGGGGGHLGILTPCRWRCLGCGRQGAVGRGLYPQNFCEERVVDKSDGPPPSQLHPTSF